MDLILGGTMFFTIVGFSMIEWLCFIRVHPGETLSSGERSFKNGKQGALSAGGGNGHSGPLMDDFFAQFLKGDFDDPVSQCGHEPRDGQSDKEERGEVKVRNERPLAN